jgi:hypothetical protein
VKRPCRRCFPGKPGRELIDCAGSAGYRQCPDCIASPGFVDDPTAFTVAEALQLPAVREGVKHAVWETRGITYRIDKTEGTLQVRWAFWGDGVIKWALTGSEAILIADLDLECRLVDP